MLCGPILLIFGIANGLPLNIVSDVILQKVFSVFTGFLRILLLLMLKRRTIAREITSVLG